VAYYNKTVQEYSQKVKESNQEVKELKEILSAELVYYYKETDTKEFADEAGNKFEILVSAKTKQKPRQFNQRNMFESEEYGN